MAMMAASSRITFALSEDFALFQSICTTGPMRCCGPGTHALRRSRRYVPSLSVTMTASH
jgi:hypothetical protein